MRTIATWNVNSLRVRLPQLTEWLASRPVHTLALQETKLEDDAFPRAEIEALTHIIRDVLSHHEEWVVFADLNLKCNVLWVSLKHQPGIMARIVTALRARAPEFKLVAHQPTQPG